ncbi:MAG: porin [Planctomycetota bacterium]
MRPILTTVAFSLLIAASPLAIAQRPPEQVPSPAEFNEILTRLEMLERSVGHRHGLVEAVGQDSTCDLLKSNSSETCDSLGSYGAPSRSTHDVIYDGGWILRPRDPEQFPFELKSELHSQLRYTLFEASERQSIDAAGNTRIIDDRNDFDINRGRLVFSGYAFDPKLQFYVNIDYSTVASDSILPLLAWTSYELTDRTEVFFGLGKVPGTWEWQQTSRYTLGADRSLATTFFRPSISAGLWVNGRLGDTVRYTAFVGDGLNTLTLRASELDTQLAYSGISWWEPLGEFGPGFSDLEFHESLAIRVGHALTHTRNESTSDESPGPEETVIRLTDGTRLVEPGALRPGETVNELEFWLYSVHCGFKRRGWSVSSEYYLRWLRELQSDAGSSFGSLFDHGFFAQVGAFVVPKRLECFARSSYISGAQGNGEEFSAGLNVFPFGVRGARATFELTDVQDSPAQQSRTGYVAGGSGLLFRAQLWTFF